MNQLFLPCKPFLTTLKNSRAKESLSALTHLVYTPGPRAHNVPVSYLPHVLHGKQMNASGDLIIEIERFIIIPMFTILHYYHYLKGLILIIK